MHNFAVISVATIKEKGTLIILYSNSVAIKIIAPRPFN